MAGRTSRIVEQRCCELGITEVYQGVYDKLGMLKIIARQHQISSEEIAYIGDDLNDLDCMQYCDFSACPQDAVDAVKRKVNYVCVHNGGRGAVREIIDLIL